MHHVWGALCWSKHGEKQGDPPVLPPLEVPQPGALPAQGLLGWNLTRWGPEGEPPKVQGTQGERRMLSFPLPRRWRSSLTLGSSPRAAAEPP